MKLPNAAVGNALETCWQIYKSYYILLLLILDRTSQFALGNIFTLLKLSVCS